jgi:hypothetical protein
MITERVFSLPDHDLEGQHTVKQMMTATAAKAFGRAKLERNANTARTQERYAQWLPRRKEL